MPNSDGPLQGTRDKLSNSARESGTSPPQPAIEQFDDGQHVHLRLDPSVQDGRFNPTFNGLTGEVIGMQGDAYKVSVNDGGKEKIIIATAAHLTAQESADS